MWSADDRVLTVGTVEFQCEYPIGAVAEGRLAVEKPRPLVDAYVELIQTLRPRFIIELGIYKGGSVALLSELADPEKIVAFELSAQRAPALTEYIEKHRRAATVRPHFGVDQADRARIATITEKEFGDNALDLVIDDASHLYDQSLASFEVLFPRVRPGGLYLIEDWRWQHQTADAAAASAEATDLPERIQHAIVARMFEAAEGRLQPVVPLSRLVLQLVLARASGGDVVADVAVGGYWAAVRRGPAVLDAGTFRVADTFEDRFKLLTPGS